MNESEKASDPGPLASARNVAAAVLALLQKRLELAAVELHEQQHRLLDQVTRLAVIIILALMAMITGTFLVVALTWDTAARLWVLLGLTLVYSGLALWCGWKLRQQLADSPPPFAATLEEFRKDRAWFQEKS